MGQALTNPDFHPPKCVNRQISAVQYAEDTVIFSFTKVELRRAFWAFTTHYSECHLVIKYKSPNFWFSPKAFSSTSADKWAQYQTDQDLKLSRCSLSDNWAMGSPQRSQQ